MSETNKFLGQVHKGVDWPVIKEVRALQGQITATVKDTIVGAINDEDKRSIVVKLMDENGREITFELVSEKIGVLGIERSRFEVK